MNDKTMDSEPVDVLAVLRAAVAQPNEYSTGDDGRWPAPREVVSANDPKWREQIECAKKTDRDFTDTLAGMGRSNPDRDAQLCAIQREQMSRGVEDVRVSTWIKGWAVRTDWADSQRIFVGYGDDPTQALVAALEWQALAPDRRGIRMYGSDYLSAVAYLESRHAALATVGVQP